MVGGSCGDDSSAVVSWVLWIGVSISVVVVSSWGIVCFAGVASWDGIACSVGVASSYGVVGSDGPGVSGLGGGKIPKCYYIC